MTVGFTENLAVISVHNVLYVDREFETAESPEWGNVSSGIL